jgi:hypothetical protein
LVKDRCQARFLVAARLVIRPKTRSAFFSGNASASQDRAKPIGGSINSKPRFRPDYFASIRSISKAPPPKFAEAGGMTFSRREYFNRATDRQTFACRHGGD